MRCLVCGKAQGKVARATHWAIAGLSIVALLLVIFILSLWSAVIAGYRV